ncbi:hypothetical protein HER32_09475 [Hymenobacter sp. BT18]|uniref:hypothetical protein n=1 Tax=Hymenobacter sp. BT18 TaxID=2835648 RepID=UPI00143ECE6A|nr:hypothetical protein [Hymenobacter sp. BT18]QIX61395.1 hypothetical protein HER32_09475 [Hymenobacter sp. BT18]
MIFSSAAQLGRARHEAPVIFLLALAMLTSTGYVLLVNHDAHFAPDELSYLQLAQGEFTNVPAIHRYRVVMPCLARLVAEAAVALPRLLGSARPLPLGASFYLVNSAALAGAATLSYLASRALGARPLPSVLGLAAVLTSGMASYLTGLALVDSGFIAIISLLWFACSTRTRWPLLLALALGPVLKETFVFFLPMALLYGRFAPFWQRLAAASGGLALCWAVRVLVEHLTPGASATVPLATLAVEHLAASQANVSALFSGAGLVALASVFGLWNGVVLLGFRSRAGVRSWGPLLPSGTGLFLLAVCLHLILSGDAARMLYLTFPVFASTVSLVLNSQPWVARLFNPPTVA